MIDYPIVYLNTN